MSDINGIERNHADFSGPVIFQIFFLAFPYIFIKS